MFRRTPRPTFVLLAGAALAAGTLCAAQAASQAAGARASSQQYGPSHPYVKILKGQFTFIPLPKAAMISVAEHGYIYRAGQQDSHLKITRVDGGLRFRDTGTRKWKSLPGACQRQRVRRGVAAVCDVPGSTSAGNPMLVQIWPRLGDDYVNARTLSAAFDLTVLGDAGVDVVHLGDGNDFVNGAFQRDVVTAGGGNDWVRTGDGNDSIQGGPGNDRLVGTAGRDNVSGGDGNDSVEGGDGGDDLYAGSGTDRLLCGAGADRAHVDGGDRTSACESVDHN